MGPNDYDDNDYDHWRRLSQNIGWVNQNDGGQKMVKSENARAFLNYWGHVPGLLPPKVYAYDYDNSDHYC